MALQGHHVQDAFHYAIAAAGGCVDGVESTFNVKRFKADTGESKYHYMRLAIRKAREAGLTNCFACTSTRPRVVDARRFTRAIEAEARANAIDANTGLPPVHPVTCKPLEGEQLDAWKLGIAVKS